MEIISTPTKQDFDRLMECLERKGVMLYEGTKPTDWELGRSMNDNDYGIYIDGKEIIGYDVIEACERKYPDVPIQTVDELIYPSNTSILGHFVLNECETRPNPYYNKLKETKMSIVKFAKNLTLSKDEKLLREAGLRDECGEWTEKANAIVANLVADEKRKELIGR